MILADGPFIIQFVYAIRAFQFIYSLPMLVVIVVVTIPSNQASRQAGLTRGDWSHRALKGPYKALNGLIV